VNWTFFHLSQLGLPHRSAGHFTFGLGGRLAHQIIVSDTRRHQNLTLDEFSPDDNSAFEAPQVHRT